MQKYYQLGRLKFKISGEDKILPFLIRELESIEVETNDLDILEFNFGLPKGQIKNGVYVAPVICSETELIFNEGVFKYSLEEQKQKFVIKLNSATLSTKKELLPKVARFIDWNYLLPAEQLAKNFMYGVFDYLSQIKNLTVGQSYIHASSFQKGDQAVAVIAWGGIGKTTAMLKLVMEDNWKFLSDDLGVIDEEGFLYRTPKKMQIYAYNLEGESILKDSLLKNRLLLDRMNWQYKKYKKGKKGVRRRVSAEELFGNESIACKAKLTNAFFIERADNKEFSSKPITVRELAERSSKTVMSEIDPYHKIETAVYSVQKQSLIPRYQDLLKNTEHILLNAFEHVQPVLIKIPLNATPDDLAGYLRNYLGELN